LRLISKEAAFVLREACQCRKLCRQQHVASPCTFLFFREASIIGLILNLV